MHRFTLLVSYFTGLIIKLNCASEVLHSLAKTHLHNEHRLHLDFQHFDFISSSDDENDKDNDKDNDNDSDKTNNNDNDNDNNKNNDNENDDDNDSCPVPSG